MEKEKRVLLATGSDALNFHIKESILNKLNYEALPEVTSEKELVKQAELLKPEILIYGISLCEEISPKQILLEVQKVSRFTRIIYLAGEVTEENSVEFNDLGELVLANIFDIYHQKEITLEVILDLIRNEKTYHDVEYLTRGFKGQKGKSSMSFEIPNEINASQAYCNKMVVVSSIKPGSGKSFISANLATAIAKYGVDTPDKKRPRVALIEGDLQNLSVGTLLCMTEDSKHNLKTVMDKISTIVSASGEFKGTPELIDSVDRYILSCFKPYPQVQNLKALTGSQLGFDEVQNILPHHYTYLIEHIEDQFDVIIVDTNSSIKHVSTLPLVKMAKTCFYVINLDFNNIRNNQRYRQTLEEMGILDKTKYILNENISDANKDEQGGSYERLEFTSDNFKDTNFDISGTIPTIPKVIYLNRLFAGTPIVLDEEDYTLEARVEILNLANKIYPIANLEKYQKKLEEQKTRGQQGKKKKWIFW